MSSPTIEFLNPSGLLKNPAFTQVVTVSGPVRTVYIGGQNGVDADGAIVGDGDIGRQTEQVLKNLEIAVAAAGGQLGDIIKWTIYVVDGQPLQPAIAAFQRAWGGRPNPPVITVAKVSGLARPDALVELDAVAVVAG